MKRKGKRFIGLLLTMLMLLSVFEVPASAATTINTHYGFNSTSTTLSKMPTSIVLTKYNSKDVDYVGWELNPMVYTISLTGKITKLKSKDTNIVKASKSTYTFEGTTSTVIELRPKKVGTTTVSFKYKNKTYKISVRVKKYTNPVSSIKIGSKTIKGSKFKNTADYTMSYSKYKSKKMKVTIKLKDGWVLYDGMQGMKNRYTWFKENNGFYLKKNKSQITPKRKWDGVFFLAENTKTGQQEYIFVTFK